MNVDHAPFPRKRVLLAGVFGPFGVDDAYGRKENIMELFHNQVTKAQGAASWRYHHRSFGLYFLAANLDAEVTVLDFPSRRRFLRELRRNYDVVGISFIAPNFVKAREMARLTRALAPRATIVLGGHGTAIEGVEERIDCDHVIRGEGIRGMRMLLGQDPDAPLVHPVLPSVERRSILGVPVPGIGATLLVPGLGCVNGCRFCSTSHFFDRRYHAFLPTGRDVFEACRRIADERGTDEFFVMDENFLKDTGRARELLGEMERHGRYFRFHIFSSAEAITAFGLDDLVRLGVGFVWIGVEAGSRQGNYPKNEGVDARALIRELRERGIVVLASGILCQEHHTPTNIQNDIDFLVGLEPDLLQFMLLTPMPVTALYREQQARHALRTDLPFEEWHGQKHLAFRHPAFPEASAERWLAAAFRQDYQVNGSSMYRVVETSLRGFRRLAGLSRRDPCLEARMRDLRDQTREWAAMLPAIASHPVNAEERRRALALAREVSAALGKPSAREVARRVAVRLLAARWRLRLALRGDGIQPKTLVTRFRPGAPGVATVPLGSAEEAPGELCAALGQ